MLALTTGRELQRGIMIDGKPLQGKRQVSVVVATGRKGDKGAPIEKDRFHLVEPNENKQKIKPYHSAFTAFNKAPLEKRRVLYGILNHISESEALWYQRLAQQLRVSFYKNLGWFKNSRDGQQTVAHPNRFPACCGGGPDGKARRWFGPDPNDFKIVDCLGERCEFSIKMNGEKKAPCGLSMEFIFQLMWKDEFAGLPSVTARYPTHGMGTLRNFIGFFDEINAAIKALGIQNPVLYGFPFMMSLGEKTKPSEGWIWPTVTITPMMSPLDFFYSQIERRKNLKDMAAQIPAVISISEEMTIRPTVYLMDEAGPLKIGNSAANGTNGTNVSPETAIEIEPEPVTEQFSEPASTKTPTQAEKVAPATTGAVDSGEKSDGREYETPKIAIPSDWGTKWRKQIAFDKHENGLAGKIWADISDEDLAAIMQKNSSDKMRKAAFCEIEWRKKNPLTAAGFPDDWETRRKVECGKGCSVAYNLCGVKTLESMRKAGDENAAFEMRWRLASAGESLPNDDGLSAAVQKLKKAA